MQSKYCSLCKNFEGTTERDCAAFVDIPSDILLGMRRHDVKLPGQDGEFVFEPTEEGRAMLEVIRKSAREGTI